MHVNDSKDKLYSKKSLTLGHAMKACLFLVENFAPAIIFLLFSSVFNLKLAIGCTVAYIVADAVRRAWLRLSFPMVYVASTSMTVGFGTIDLFYDEPFMLRYEAVISSVLFAGIFIAGSRGRISMLQELAEQKRGEPFLDRPDLVQFFRYLTLMWGAYFLCRAVLYLWLGLTLSLEQALMVYATFGNISLILMIILNVTQSQRIYWLMQKWGWLPPPPAEISAKQTLPAGTTTPPQT